MTLEDDWESHAEWWLDEVTDDPIYQSDVLPMALEFIGPFSGIALDLGCGEGQVMRSLSGRVVGTDISSRLLRKAAAGSAVVRGRLPDLGWMRPAVIDVAYAVLVVEHLPDLSFFESAFRVVRSGGRLVVVVNHPAFTAADAGPIMDQSDGEFLWRWGDYFRPSRVPMPVTGGAVVFHHRPLGEILNAAAAAGWVLDRFVETGFSAAAIAARPGYRGQEQMPRLLGLRWTHPATRSSDAQHSR